MKYLDKNKRRITLPSGAEIDIFKLNSFSEPFLTSGKQDDTAAGLGLSLFILESKVGPLCHQGESGKIVNKPKDQCAEGEIPIELLEQADADAIINQVIEFSGLNKAGAEARKTFPERQEASRVPASAG